MLRRDFTKLLAASSATAALASIGARDTGFPLPHGRGDEFHRGSPAPDPREPANLAHRPGHFSDLTVKTRNFR